MNYEQDLQDFRRAFVIAVGDASPFAREALKRFDGAYALLSKLRTPVADERVPHHDQPQQTGVGEWCAPGPAAEQRRAWLLRFADTERGDCIYYDEQEARRAFAQAEGRGWNCYLFEFARRAALASAPVAGEEQKPVRWMMVERRMHSEPDYMLTDPTGVCESVYVPLYAAPQASEAARDALDAERWRAFIGSARIRSLGSAGLEQADPNHYAHLGLEIWTVYGRDYSPELLKKMDAENERGRRWLVMFADVARAALSAQPGAQTKESDS